MSEIISLCRFPFYFGIWLLKPRLHDRPRPQPDPIHPGASVNNCKNWLGRGVVNFDLAAGDKFDFRDPRDTLSY